MTKKYTALVPVKSLLHAKSRFIPHLNQPERKTLVLRMLQHVLSILQNVSNIEHISVVTSDTLVKELVTISNIHTITDTTQTHNEALYQAALYEKAHGASSIITISADIPLLTISDIQTMLIQAESCNIVLAPSIDNLGTNAIITHPPLVIPYLFGQNSFERYKQNIYKNKLTYSVYKSPTIGLDIDTIEELKQLTKIKPDFVKDIYH